METNTVSFLNQKTNKSMECYIDSNETTHSETEAVGMTNSYQVCFNNSFKFYMEEF
jgi:hypothetical protein